ncbi:hypothetical protein BO94DRAFT_620479 [Aspergillus sclerotioniger CBS 115572]|uniref:Uncharacterized protein n=1 Tax=Aspergillus sclerotioniger CBS 115572 TaxID=1450535 RepID=A0A317XBI8_9EURO|nr:hypothetical protein BO94DRAFT_620479 [Aspergillus sclerotioniger CBS 115572]PWY94977.1 hypothetical protein BO94DRAFT_620479 [Aspergillus sclerotioniger CBS 115572]
MISLNSALVLILQSLGQAQGQPYPCSGQPRACVAHIVDGANPTPPLTSRLADCSSYQAVVVTPHPTTVTTTVATETVTVTTTLGGPVQRRANVAARQVTSTPTAVPTYLDNPCFNPGVYGSACACLGVSQTTTTAPTPTSTVSVTVTTTTTTTVTPCVGGNCGSYVPVPCPEGVCACGFDVNGDTFCFVGEDCGPQCTTNAECGAGFRCLVGSCCGDNVCNHESTGSCLNPPLQLQGAPPVDLTGCSSVSCPDGDDI